MNEEEGRKEKRERPVSKRDVGWGVGWRSMRINKVTLGGGGKGRK